MTALMGAERIFKLRKYPRKYRTSSPTVSHLPCCHTPRDLPHSEEKQLSQAWHPCPSCSPAAVWTAKYWSLLLLSVSGNVCGMSRQS